MALGAGSEIEISLIDEGVKWLFLKVWGKTVKVTEPQGAKRKFTQKCFYASDRCPELLLASCLNLFSKRM
ncbi:hypothetical protein Hanom_Chr17g01528841 [Helianthus anomalus]